MPRLEVGAPPKNVISENFDVIGPAIPFLLLPLSKKMTPRPLMKPMVAFQLMSSKL